MPRLPAPLPRRRSSASLLALAYAALVVYASLYPFWPWSLPPALAGESLLSLPWPRYWGGVDLWANLLGYLPLGLLLFAACMRSGWRLGAGLALALLLPLGLSFGLECLQYLLPRRVPSLLDWLLNSAGAWLGVLLGLLLYALGGLTRWHARREHWFVADSAGALALLALWPVGLLAPLPLPLGLGQVLPRVSEAVADAVTGTPWALQWEQRPPLTLALPPGVETLAVALGLLTPCLLALAIARPGRQRLVLVPGAMLMGLSGMTLSTALNFGPQNASAWLTPSSLPGLGLGALLGLAMCLLSRRAAAAAGLVAVCAQIALVSQAPTNPYLAQTLAAWEQGRFINFYGLVQWLAWLWPFAVLAQLLALLVRREPRVI